MAGAARGSRGARGVLPWLLLISSVSGYVETDEFISDLDKPIPTAAVQGVVGKKASLPCDIQPLTAGDQVSMVLWFKEADGEPLYSYDVRGRLPSQPKLWSSAAGFAARAVFRAAAAPAALVVDPVARADAGLYRCRVDFRNSPTRNMRLNFTVITPPNRPNILDAKTRDPTRLLEPYNEGDTLELICEVTGGDPPPRVTWLLENTVIDDSSTTRADGAVVNALTFPRVGRQHLAARLVCQASNTNLAPPQNKVLILDLNLRPLTVEIIKPRGALSADRGAQVSCRSAGARPDAAVTWWRGAKQLRRGVKNFSSTNSTTSELSFTPEADDHGRVLTCRAHNPRIPDSALEDKFKMNVHYTPLVSLKMGSSLQPALIKEGDDVYFECGVQANPRPHRLTWYKGDTEIVHNASAGVILSDQSLVLQSVTRAAAGDYSCLAANSEGAGASNPVSLQVRYAPVCATPAAEGGVYGALKHETVTLRCDVDSSPPPTSFVWTFNSSGEQNEVPPSSYTSNAFTSVLRYTPVRDVDFGTISCAAHNGVGEQDAPCLYRLIAASPPQSPQNCSVSRGGAARLRVACAPGVDGGLPQHFRLEVLELPYMLARFNFSSNSSPEFNVTGLDARVSYALRVTSLNAKGASDPVELYTVAARPPDKYTGASSSLSISPMLVSLLALAALLAAAVCAVITALYRCSARRHAAGKQAPAPDALYLERSVESLSAKQDSYCVSPLRYEGGGAGGAGGVGGEDEPDIIPGNYDKLPPPPEYLRLRPAPYQPADMYSGTQFGDNCLSPGSLSRGVSARAADLAPRPEIVTTARKVKESCI